MPPIRRERLYSKSSSYCSSPAIPAYNSYRHFLDDEDDEEAAIERAIRAFQFDTAMQRLYGEQDLREFAREVFRAQKSNRIHEWRKGKRKVDEKPMASGSNGWMRGVRDGKMRGEKDEGGSSGEEWTDSMESESDNVEGDNRNSENADNERGSKRKEGKERDQTSLSPTDDINDASEAPYKSSRYTLPRRTTSGADCSKYLRHKHQHNHYHYHQHTIKYDRSYSRSRSRHLFSRRTSFLSDRSSTDNSRSCVASGSPAPATESTSIPLHQQRKLISSMNKICLTSLFNFTKRHNLPLTLNTPSLHPLSQTRLTIASLTDAIIAAYNTPNPGFPYGAIWEDIAFGFVGVFEAARVIDDAVIYRNVVLQDRRLRAMLSFGVDLVLAVRDKEGERLGREVIQECERLIEKAQRWGSKSDGKEWIGMENMETDAMDEEGEPVEKGLAEKVTEVVVTA